MKLHRFFTLILALGASLASCGEPFEGDLFGPVASGGVAGSGGNSSAGNGADAGNAGTSTNAGNAGSMNAGSAGNASGGSAGAEGVAGSAGESGVGGEGGGPAPPVALEGLVLWLRATHGVEHDNGIVSAWADQSGSANHATQTAEGVMPKLDAGGLDGLPALIFDDDDFLSLPTGFSDFSQGVTVFAVAQFDQDACVALLYLGNGGEVDDITVGRYQEAFLYEVADFWDQSALLALGAPTLLSVVHRQSEEIDLRINQLLVAEPSWPLPVTVDREQSVVGRSDYGGCGALQGKLAELLVYTRTVSDDELLAIEGYLQRQWACCK